MLGVLLHILMNVPTAYGTRVLSPFNWHWYAVNWMPIIDIYLWTILAAGLLAGSVLGARDASAGRAESRHRARRRSAAIALLLMGANYGLRATMHHQAHTAAAPGAFGRSLPAPCEGSARSRLVEQWSLELPALSRPGVPDCLVEISALPTFMSPFEWRLIARLSRANCTCA